MLKASRVQEVMKDCLFNPDEIGDDGFPEDPWVPVKGIVANFGFHKGRLDGHKEEIVGMLDELNEEFKKGCSFLQACIDKKGNHWGEHPDVEALMVLGMAVKRVKYCLPRELWPSLPGSMPYFVILEEDYVGDENKTIE